MPESPRPERVWVKARVQALPLRKLSLPASLSETCKPRKPAQQGDAVAFRPAQIRK